MGPPIEPADEVAEEKEVNGDVEVSQASNPLSQRHCTRSVLLYIYAISIESSHECEASQPLITFSQTPPMHAMETKRAKIDGRPVQYSSQQIDHNS